MDLFLISGAFILALGLVLWLVSLLLKNASIVDPCWGLFFLLPTWTTALVGLGGPNLRQTILVVLVTLWGLRLVGYLSWRNWGEPEDFRYAKWRVENGPKWWWKSLFKVFLLQGLIAWLLCVPLIAGQYSQQGLGVMDGLAITAWLLGFFFETAGDWQLAHFKGKPENKGKLLASGVWRYSRHPNYFGEAAQWWGFYLLAAAAGAWWTVYAPIGMTFLLLKVSGVSLLEKSLIKTKPKYAQYAKTTPAFFPWFPKG